MASPSSGSSAIKGAYWRSWCDDFPPSSIATKLFTHIYYAFLAPNNATYKFKIDDPTYRKLINFTSTLRAMKPPVKTLVSIGGANADPSFFSKMASSSSSRATFIESTIQVARKFSFDGIDLDWQYPKTPNDMDNLGSLLYEWRAAVTTDASRNGKPPLLLSAATYFSVEFFLSDVKRIYPVKSISENLDWINVMCYDYRGGWDTSMTGAHAALYDPKSKISTSDGLGSWIKAGLPSKKFVMGLPLYGHTWTLKNSALNGIGALAVAVGPGNDGVMPYSKVEKFNAEKNATVVYDALTVSTYSVAGTSWIGYDDVNSIKVKIEYAQTQKTGGYFFWTVNDDHKWKISETASKLWKL